MNTPTNSTSSKTIKTPMRQSTKSELVMRYLTQKPSGEWTSPTEIGRRVWGLGHHSSSASPVCKRLVADGKLARSTLGHYRISSAVSKASAPAPAIMHDGKLISIMETALIFAARYTHPRTTGGTLSVVNALKKCWPAISTYGREQILGESHEASSNQDDWLELRNFAEEYKNKYGNE